MVMQGKKMTAAEAFRVQEAGLAVFGAGPVRVMRAFEVLPGGTRRAVGERVCRMDAFDEMERRAMGAWRRGGEVGVFVAPFTAAQVSEGRRYAGLMQVYSAGLCKGQDLGRSGGGDGSSAMDRYLEAGEAVRAYWGRIGGGVGHSLRRVRPSSRGGVITDRAVVDGVCVDGLTLAGVLGRHGWPVTGLNRERLRVALVGALDRMQGFGGGVGAK